MNKMNRSRKTFIELGLGLVALALVAAFGLTALFQSPTAVKAATTTSSVASTSIASAAVTTTVKAEAHNASGMRQLFMSVAMTTANTLNLSPMQLVSEMQADKSIADVAKAQNVDLQKVKDAILTTTKTQLDAAVKSGELSQTWADKAYQTATIWIDELLNLHKSFLTSNLPNAKTFFEGVAQAAATSLNLTPTQLENELKVGKSLADVAKAQNVDVQKVEDAITNTIKAQLAAEVASGQATQAQANATNQTVALWLNDLVNLHKDSMDKTSH